MLPSAASPSLLSADLSSSPVGGASASSISAAGAGAWGDWGTLMLPALSGKKRGKNDAAPPPAGINPNMISRSASAYGSRPTPQKQPRPVGSAYGSKVPPPQRPANRGVKKTASTALQADAWMVLPELAKSPAGAASSRLNTKPATLLGSGNPFPLPGQSEGDLSEQIMFGEARSTLFDGNAAVESALVGPANVERGDVDLPLGSIATSFSSPQVARSAMLQDLFGAPQGQIAGAKIATSSNKAAPSRDAAEAAVHNLPLSFLRQHEHLRPIALEKALRTMCKPLAKFAIYILGFNFVKWREAASALKRRERRRRDMHLSYQMIIKVLLRALDRSIDRRFQHWARLCRRRYQKDHLRSLCRASVKIQRFIRRRQRGVVDTSPAFRSAFALCMDRRRAIQGTIEFHRQRARAIKKLRLAVLYRRRMHFAARVIQRAYRWYRVVKYVSLRLQRRIASRAIRKWWLQYYYARTAYRNVLVAYLVSHGGFNRIKRKIPRDYRRGGVFFGMHMCACRLQQWYRRCSGMFHLHVKVIARRQRKEFERRVYPYVVVIQNTFRAFMWQMLMLKVRQNNRARRIQRAFRAYQYRVWVEAAMERRRVRKAIELKHFILRLMGKWRLNVRFRQREHRKKLEIARRNEAASRIRHAYMSKKLYQNYSAQRKVRITGIMERYKALRIAAIRRLQRFYRTVVRPDLASRHLLIIARRHALLIYQRETAAAKVIQKFFRPYIDHGVAVTRARKAKAQVVLRRMFTSYSLRSEIDRRAMCTLQHKIAAVNVISKLFSHCLWMKFLNRRFIHMRFKLEHARELDRCARVIQVGLRRKIREYNMPLRIAARSQLARRRRQERERAELQLRISSKQRVVRAVRDHLKWKRFLVSMDAIREELHRRRAARKIYSFFRAQHLKIAVSKLHALRLERAAEAQRCEELKRAANRLGKFWKRLHERHVLVMRFKIRRKILDEYARLEREKFETQVECERIQAEMHEAELAFQASVAAAWTQGSDEHGRNYYYNFITGESQWERPLQWETKEVDKWVKNRDEKGNIYYYNLKTAESRWLPPCCCCSGESHKWCVDCGVAYCSADFSGTHFESGGSEGSRSPFFVAGISDHKWTPCEVEREQLSKGEAYCPACKKRACKKLCVTCWDYYCDECFEYTHNVGSLRTHRSIGYAEAKQGWVCVKSIVPGEQDYYINGKTGETTYIKPEELLTSNEKLLLDNFKIHRQAAETHVKTIEKLQYELEALRYERALGFSNMKKKLQAELEKGGIDAAGALAALSPVKKAPTGTYRERIAAPSERRRGKTQTDELRAHVEASAANLDKFASRNSVKK